MRSFWGNAGNINLRGRKYRLLSCQCCSVRDLRDFANDNLIRHEIEDAMTDSEYRNIIRDEDEMISELSDCFSEPSYQYWLEYKDVA